MRSQKQSELWEHQGVVHSDWPDAGSLGAAAKHLHNARSSTRRARESVSTLCGCQGGKLWCVVVLGVVGVLSGQARQVLT
jgi:hypothetical protein